MPGRLFAEYLLAENFKCFVMLSEGRKTAVETSLIFVNHIKNDKLTAFVWVYEILRLRFTSLRMTKYIKFLSKFSSTFFKRWWGVGAKPQGIYTTKF